MMKTAVWFLFISAVTATELNSEMQASISAFSTNLLKEILREEKGDVMISALSVYSLLAILQYGSHANTKQQMDEVLHASRSETREAFLNLTRSIEDADSIESLRFWSFGKMKDLHTFTPGVEEILYEDYASRFNAHQLPYYKTGNISMRTDMVLSDKVSEDELFDMMNLLAFYGLWSHKGISHQNITFNPEPGKEIKVRAISMRKTCFYGNSSEVGARWVHMPLAVKKPCVCRNKPTAEEYWSDRNVSLLLVLPMEKHGLEKLMEKLIPEDIINFINYSSEPEDWTHVKVTLPPFNINTSLDFIPYLKKLGVQDLFGKQSELSGFSSHQELYVTQAVQSGQFIVDEYGARTKLYSDFHFPFLHKDLGEDNGTFVEFILDEPFLFFLVDETNLVPLLSGRVVQPVARNWNPFTERELRLKKLNGSD